MDDKHLIKSLFYQRGRRDSLLLKSCPDNAKAIAINRIFAVGPSWLVSRDAGGCSPDYIIWGRGIGSGLTEAV